MARSGDAGVSLLRYRFFNVLKTQKACLLDLSYSCNRIQLPEDSPSEDIRSSGMRTVTLVPPPGRASNEMP